MKAKGMPIPDDWELETGEWFCACIAWPDSVAWRGILLGFLSTPARGRFWDIDTGTITDAQAVGKAIWEENNPMRKCDEILAHLDTKAEAMELMSLTAALSDLDYRYDGSDPRTLHKDAPNDTFAEATDDTPTKTAYRDLALCWQSKQTVNALCDGELERRQAIGDTIAVIGALFAILCILTGGTAALIVGAIAAFLSFEGGAFSVLETAILGDENARFEVGCCLYNTLKALSVTRENFIAGLDSCGNLSTNGELIRLAVKEYLEAPSAFESFVANLGAAWEDAEKGFITECGCEQECTFGYGSGMSPSQYISFIGDGWYETGSGGTQDSGGGYTFQIMFTNTAYCSDTLWTTPAGPPDSYAYMINGESEPHWVTGSSDFSPIEGLCLDWLYVGASSYPIRMELELSCPCV